MVGIIPRGGLGNCLYQYSAVMAHAWRNGFEYAIPLQNENPHYKGQKPYIFPGVNYCETIPDLPRYDEPHFHYSPIPPTDNIILNGYFQSFRYSEDFRDEILKAFGFKWEQKKGFISLHYRAGDYRNYPDHHPVVSDEYIHNSVAHFVGKGYTKFLVFSNEIDAIGEILSRDVYAGLDFEFSKGKTELEDLELGSYCEGHILSNGTFSVWQYYLNQTPDKMCTAPRRWFGKMLPHDTKDLIPSEAVLF